MTAPHLSPTDIQLELERIFSRDRRSRLAALYGQGEQTELTALGERWRVVPTSCELELRARMPESPDDQRRLYLVDWTDEPLPLDLRCRLAGGHVFRISRSTRLATLFGARSADDSLMATGLAQVLLSGQVSGLKKVTGLVLTREAATRRFMDAWLGFPISCPLNPVELLAWGADNQAGPALVQRARGSQAWGRLRQELSELVAGQAAPLGGMIWRAWECGRIQEWLQLAVLVDAQARTGDPVARGLLEATLSARLPEVGAELIGQGPQLAPVLNEVLGERLDRGRVLKLLEAAEALIMSPSFAETTASSPWLMSGHRARQDELGAALATAAQQRSLTSLRAVADALGALERHHLDDGRTNGGVRRLRRMGARLAAWLVDRDQAPGVPAGTPPSHQAVALAERFAQEGGWVDWCRQRVRSPHHVSPALREGLLAVLRASDDVRAQDNQAFAKGWLSWNASGRPSSRVTPIERAVSRLVGELHHDVGCKILVVLMDGMSWANAAQLMTRLQDERWGTISWRPKGFSSASFLPPVLADVPTVTSLSRAAFFAGKSDPRFGDQPTADDGKRWARHPLLRRLAQHHEVPALVPQKGLMRGGELRKDVKELVASDAPVVAVIINALDSELSGTSQVYKDYSDPGILKPLEGLIDVIQAASSAGSERVVLLASDHGHVPGDAMTAHGETVLDKREGGKRWRAIGADQTVHPFEVRLPSSAWSPRDAVGTAVIWDERVSHGAPKYGEHGGISLPEVVAPALLIAPDWLADEHADQAAALETHPFLPPSWWDLDVRAPAARASAPSPKPLPAQLSFVASTAPPPTKAAPARRIEPALVAALRGSAIFKKQVEGQAKAHVDRVLRYLSALVEAGGALSDADFARAVGIRRHRVAGTVARMGILNCDGFAMVEHDLAGRRVVLHRSRLAQQYGITP